MTEYPHIMVGCPIRNRQWALGYYLNALQQMNYPQSCLEYCFIVNDCTDATEEILRNFVDQPVRGQVIVHNLGRKSTLRCERGYYSLRNLSWLRNQLIDAFLQSKAQYLFSLDSDILVTPDGLQQLLADNCDMVAALVSHGLMKGRPIYNILMRNESGEYVFPPDYPTGLFAVDCTGAACLISRRLIESGVVYCADLGSEDVGFCLQAQQKGLSIYCDSRVKFCHIKWSHPDCTVFIQ